MVAPKMAPEQTPVYLVRQLQLGFIYDLCDIKLLMHFSEVLPLKGSS